MSNKKCKNYSNHIYLNISANLLMLKIYLPKKRICFFQYFMYITDI